MQVFFILLVIYHSSTLLCTAGRQLKAVEIVEKGIFIQVILRKYFAVALNGISLQQQSRRCLGYREL